MLLSEAVSDFLDDTRAHGRGDATTAGYWSQLHLLMEWLYAHGVEHLDGVTGLLLNHYIGEMRRRENLQRGGKLSPVTIKKRVMFLRQFFGWCHVRGVSRENPAAALEIPKAGRRLPKTVPRDEITVLFDTSRWRDNGQRVRDCALLRLMFDSGLRLGELCALDVGDVDLSACIVHVRAGKWDQERFSVFTRLTANCLRAWLDVRPSGDVFFVTGAGERLTTDGMYKIVRRRAREAGVRVRVSPHRARHSFATYALEAGHKLQDVQLLMGHEDPKTTMGYNAVAVGRLQREHEQLSLLPGIENTL